MDETVLNIFFLLFSFLVQEIYDAYLEFRNPEGIQLAELFLKKSKTNLHNINFVGKYSNGLQKKNTIKDLLSILDKKKYLKNQKFNIKITKNIPHRSGMGGGSMNAASILKFFIDKNFINLQKTTDLNGYKSEANLLFVHFFYILFECHGH